VLSTQDGGTTWSAVALTPRAVWRQITFVDPEHGWVAGTSGSGIQRTRAVLLATDDGGTTWSRRYIGEKGSDLTAISFSDARHGWAVAGMFAGVPNPILATDDGGATWTVRGVTRQALASIACLNGTLGWAAGQYGTIVATTNGGISSDSVAPRTEVRGAAGWHNQDVRLRLVPRDAGGSGVVWSQFRGETGSYWSTGRAWVTARPDHASDGVNTVYVRSVDAAGNIEQARAVRVLIDTRPPQVEAPYPATCVSGGDGRITFRVTDVEPCGMWSSVTIIAIAPDGGEFAIGDWPRLRVGVWQTVTFTCRLPRGTYHFAVYAKDAAGNESGETEHVNVLTVR